VPPLKRLNYVPEHYAATQTDPNFGQVIAATCMIAVTCFYYMAKSPSGIQPNLFSLPKASVAVHHSSATALFLPPAKSASVAKSSAATKPATRSAPQPTTPAKPSVKSKTIGSIGSHARLEKAQRNSNSHHDAFFVPPPPPMTYAYPVRPMPFIPYMVNTQGNVQNPNEFVRPLAPKVKAEHPVINSPVAKVAPVTDNGTVSSDWLPTPAPSLTQKYENRQPRPQGSIHKSIDAQAPSPGSEKGYSEKGYSEKGYPQLERIVLPSSN
jgi:hypothetical protein